MQYDATIPEKHVKTAAAVYAGNVKKYKYKSIVGKACLKANFPSRMSSCGRLLNDGVD